MNNMPKNDFFHKGGASNSSKVCPLNSNILKPKIVKSEQKTTESSTEPSDQKSYYLLDQLSGWSTREIGLPDNENMSVEGWPSAENPHQEYYDKMKNYLASDMVNYLKDSQDRENKINSLHENAKKHTNSFGLNSFKNSSNPLAAILADKYGNKYATGRSLADLRNSRLFKKPGESNMTRIPEVPKYPTFPTIPKVFDEEEELDELALVEARANTESNEKITTVDQRLQSLPTQPLKCSELLPVPGKMIMQSSLKYDGHRVFKPDYDASKVKPKINSLAIEIVPWLEISNATNKSADIIITNQIVREITVSISKFEYSSLKAGVKQRNGISQSELVQPFIFPNEEIKIKGHIEEMSVTSTEQATVNRISDEVVTYNNRAQITVNYEPVEKKLFYIPLSLKFDFETSISPILHDTKKDNPQESQSKISWVEVNVLLKVQL